MLWKLLSLLADLLSSKAANLSSPPNDALLQSWDPPSGSYSWCTSRFKPGSLQVKQKAKEILNIYKLYYHTANSRTSWPTPPFSHRGLDLPSPFRAPGYHRSAIGDGAAPLPAAPHAHLAKRCVYWRCGYCECRLQEQAVCRWPPTKLSGPHVHRSLTATARPRPRAARRGSCPADRPRAAPQPRAADGGPCPANILAAPAIAGPRPRAAPAGAGSARFAHTSLRPPFRIWWGQCSGVWHKG